MNKILQNCELEDRDIEPSDNEWYSDPDEEPEAAILVMMRLQNVQLMDDV